MGSGTGSRGAGLRGAWLTSALVFGVVGCGGNETGLKVVAFPVKGKVTFDGQPAAGAFVVFHPRTAAKPGEEVLKPRATVQPDGAFTLSTASDGDGAPAGEYDVTVQWTKPVKQGPDLVAGPNVIPKAYAEPATTPLHVTVRDSDNALEPFAITRK
jgi:hypothetical protein